MKMYNFTIANLAFVQDFLNEQMFFFKLF